MVLWKWIKRSVYYLMIAVLLLAIGGTSYQLIREHLDNSKYPPPGQLVNVGEGKIHYQVMGEGSPTVILDAGIGGSSIDWTLVQPEIAAFTKVLSYDRAGYGWSDEVNETQTGWEVVDDLNTLLENQRIEPPYVLVGHSLGAVFMRLYANQYPEKVAGLVLVDPPHESLEELIPEPPEEIVMPDPQAIEMMSQMGLQRILLEWAGSAPETLPPSTQKVWLAKQASTKQTRASLRESESLDNFLNELVPLKESIGQRPFAVITAGKRSDLTLLGLSDEWDEYARARFDKTKELHEVMAKEAPRGRHYIAEDSNHMVPWNQPQIIVDAVRDVVEEVRENEQ